MPDNLDAEERGRLLNLFNADRVLAHQVIFRHRHPDKTPLFHEEIIQLWHSMLPVNSRALVMAFREAAKSTIAEESIVLMAALRSFRNCIILGENQERAVDRLTAIKYELVHNEFLISLFGPLQDRTKWNEAKIILMNGVAIQALGRGQEVRGMKHLDTRPDFCFADDVEGKEHVRDERARRETLSWFFAEVLPALDKTARIRVNATPLDTASLPMQLLRLPAWVNKRYPIRYIAADSQWKATWSERYPLAWIHHKEEEMRRLGLHHEFMREYMCEPDDPSKKLFTSAMFKVEPRVHVWQPAFAFYDPARTARADSHSTTGWAVWSWVGGRLVVWDGGGERWLPDQMVEHVFRINDQYHPVKIGIEKDGLEEFVLQPMRREMARRGVLIPLEAVAAPKGKLDFIGSLQPFFAAGEVSFAKAMPELEAQFLNFPTGHIDAPNALAYSLKMRPGLAVYEDFNSQHVVETCIRHERAPVWLALNATRGCVTGVLCQFVDGRLNVWADWIMEGEAAQVVESLVKEARLEAGHELRLIAPATVFAGYDTIGLVSSVRKLPAELRQGADILSGRQELMGLLKQTVKGQPALALAHAAHWTINAFSSGYARGIGARGDLSAEPKDGVYRVLMEGLESFVGLAHFAVDEADKPNYAYTSTGQRYKTILPVKQETVDEKSSWIGHATDFRGSLRQR